MDISEYFDLLASHDWYYQYSDDHSVWCRGRDASERLRYISKTSDKHLALLNAWYDYIANRETAERPVKEDWV